jgi:probable phosphoglycerate mutase
MAGRPPDTQGGPGFFDQPEEAVLTTSGRLFIVEADGGSRGNPGPAAYGAVVRDPQTSEVLAAEGLPIGRATNNVAEYRGLIAGLEMARDLDPTAALDVRMDSKLVIEQMAGRWKIKHPDMKPLALQATRLRRRSGQSRLGWRSRSATVPGRSTPLTDRLVRTGSRGRRAEEE